MEKNKNGRYTHVQTLAIIAGTLKAALLIAGAFIGAFFLFILALCLLAG